MTYPKEGVNKQGVRAEDHANIYSGKRAEYFKGEKDNGIQSSIRMACHDPRDKLDDASRLNYADPHAVEYNVKVRFIGSIHGSSIQQLKKDFDRILTTSGMGCVSRPEHVAFKGTEDVPNSSAYYSGSPHNAGPSNPAVAPYTKPQSYYEASQEPWDSGVSYQPANAYGNQSYPTSGAYYSEPHHQSAVTYTGSSYGASREPYRNEQSFSSSNTDIEPLHENRNFGSGVGGHHSSHPPQSEYGYGGIQQALHHQYEPQDEPGQYSGTRGDPGEKLREPGDSDDTGDQRDGDRAGGQRKVEEYFEARRRI
jgi:hypothetical protein